MEYVQALETHGDYERYKILLQRRLQESGWCDQVRLQAREIVKQKGPNITVDQLLEDLLPQGRATVPSSIKKELLLKVKQGLLKVAGIDDINQHVHTYCPDCGVTEPGCESRHPGHSVDSGHFSGVYLELDFISEEEEHSLLNALDALPWDLSQSGRRKQNFGPKCNFKKRRLQLGNFSGFPQSTKFVQDRFSKTEILKDYITIEQCSLDYNEKSGASIDPHIDDCWIWGERIVTVNLLSDSVLTLLPYHGDRKRYNLEMAPEHLRCLPDEERVVRVPMPRRSLLVLFGEARYCWEHCVLREDISGRRVCLAYREFTPPYLPGSADEVKSRDVLELAHTYW